MSLLMEVTVAGTVRRISGGGYSSADYYWDAMIISAPTLSLGYGDSGGYIRPSYGDVELSPALFADVPDSTIPAVLYWLDISTLATTELFSGTLVLKQIGRDAVTYSIREPDFDAELLATGVDEAGTICDKPLAMGTVATAAHRAYFPAVRTTDVGGNQTYYKAGGYKETGLNAWDDYVDVTASMTDNHPADPYGTFSLSSVPNATVYITCAAQDISTLADLVDYVAGQVGATATYPAAYSSLPIVKYRATGRKSVDFLDQACGFYGQVFYFSGDLSEMTFVDRATDDPSPISLDSFDFFSAPIEGLRLIKSIKARSENARLKEKDPVDTTKYRLADKEWIASVSGGAHGDEIEVETFLDYGPKATFLAQNRPRLASLLTLWAKAWAAVELPIDGNIYDPGRDLIITDDTFSVTLTTTMKILGIEYDFNAETVTYRGPGETT